MAITINGSGTIGGISVGGLPDGIVDTDMLAAGAVTAAKRGDGAILQVKQTVNTEVESFASANTNTFVDIPDMSVTITPTSSTNKVLVFFTANCAQSAAASLHLRLVRGSTSIFQGDAAGNRLGSTQSLRPAASPYVYELRALTGAFLDSPATTSATTYKLQGTLGSTYSGTFYLNRAKTDSDEDYGPRTASSIIVMEVAA